MAKKKIRAVLAGCGSMSHGWLSTEAVKKNVEVVGFMDINLEAAKQKAAGFGKTDAIFGTNLRQLIKDSKPEILFDVSIPEAHFRNTVLALGMGLHVLGEKPMADKLSRAKKMVSAAKKADKIYAVIQNRRYTKEIQIVRNALKAGVIGKLHTVQSDFFLGPHFGGFRDEMQYPLILDMSIHTFDAARFLSGADAKAVFCRAFNPHGSWYSHGASANAIFEMDNGITYTYNGSWCAAAKHTTWEASWRFMGDKGAITWDGGNGISCEVVSGKKGFFREVKEKVINAKFNKNKINGHSSNIQEFLDAVRSGKEPMTICTDNIKSLAMVETAIKSDKTKRFQPIVIDSELLDKLRNPIPLQKGF